jgi:hypothetical protein
VFRGLLIGVVVVVSTAVIVLVVLAALRLEGKNTVTAATTSPAEQAPPRSEWPAVRVPDGTRLDIRYRFAGDAGHAVVVRDVVEGAAWRDKPNERQRRDRGEMMRPFNERGSDRVPLPDDSVGPYHGLLDVYYRDGNGGKKHLATPFECDYELLYYGKGATTGNR